VIKTPLSRVLIVFLLAISFQNLFAQCMYYPVTVEQRVSKAQYIVLAKITEKHTYIDQATGHVNTLNKLSVNAWLKNYSDTKEIYIITLGGIYENIATQVNPSLQLDQQHEYLLMLEADNSLCDDKNFRAKNPQALQVLTYADVQGCLPNNNNSYFDLSDKSVKTEQQVFQKIQNLTGQQARYTSGDFFQPRTPVQLNDMQIDVVGGFSPTTTHGGTIVPGDFITINGSGFGASAGTVFFTNADDGGATFTSSGVASDIVSWADGSITVKVAAKAGTGPININGAMTSGSNLTIDYSHSAINSNFSGFGATTRQRYYFRNMNTKGGYTYQYNTTSGFSANAPAMAAFQRALISWRCATGINWRIGANTANTLNGLDNINVVMFDGTLPAGTLGRATSTFQGSATGGCNVANTVWCAADLDIQFYPDPPVSGFPWEYGPAAPSFSEYDFESVALHELGHHHGLNHVISAGAVMHWALANGSFNRTLSANDIAGGNARIAYSTPATCFNPSAALCGSGPMTTIGAGICATLPVNLTAFTGERINFSSNKLKWTTAQEENSKAFYIQRSANGTSFSDIDFVNAAGSSTQSLNYFYDDKKAGPYAWYYRLRMIDIDGVEKLSSVVFIDGEQSNQWKVWAGEKGDKIYLFNNISIGSNAVLKIFATNGQQVMIKTISAGANEINAGNLSRGIYHYQLAYEGKIITGKLLLGSD
jgi:hypothetical protein